MDNTAFFYGTLMAPGVLHRVIYGTQNPSPVDYPAMRHLKIRPAVLEGYRRHKVLLAEYPAIMPEEGGRVRGTLVEGLTSGDIWRLDLFEGCQYQREWVRVKPLDDIELSESSNQSRYSGGEKKSETNGISQNGTKQPPSTPPPADEELVPAQTYVWFSSPSELEAAEWDFEEFKRDKMEAWMGLASNDGDEYEEHAADAWDNGSKVVKDSGFDDVDNAVADLERQKHENGTGEPNGTDKAHIKHDGMGGRGVNGAIGKALAEAHKTGKGEAEKPEGGW